MAMPSTRCQAVSAVHESDLMEALALVEAALDHPIGTQPLTQLAQPGQRVAVIVDDYTRKTPVSPVSRSVAESAPTLLRPT